MQMSSSLTRGCRSSKRVCPVLLISVKYLSNELAERNPNDGAAEEYIGQFWK